MWDDIGFVQYACLAAAVLLVLWTLRRAFSAESRARVARQALLLSRAGDFLAGDPRTLLLTASLLALPLACVAVLAGLRSASAAVPFGLLFAVSLLLCSPGIGAIVALRCVRRLEGKPPSAWGWPLFRRSIRLIFAVREANLRRGGLPMAFLLPALVVERLPAWEAVAWAEALEREDPDLADDVLLLGEAAAAVLFILMFACMAFIGVFFWLWPSGVELVPYMLPRLSLLAAAAVAILAYVALCVQVYGAAAYMKILALPGAWKDVLAPARGLSERYPGGRDGFGPIPIGLVRILAVLGLGLFLANDLFPGLIQPASASLFGRRLEGLVTSEPHCTRYRVCWARVQFQAAPGEAVEAEVRVLRKSGLRKGQRVRLKFLPAKPDWVAIDGERWGWSLRTLVYVALFFVIGRYAVLRR